MRAPNFTRDRKRGAINGGQVGWGQVPLCRIWRKHLLFQSDLKVNKMVAREVYFHFISATKTGWYKSSTAGHPKITAGNVRLQCVRWGRERWGAHFVVYHHLFRTTFPHLLMFSLEEVPLTAETVLLRGGEPLSFRHIGSLKIACDS